MVTSRRAVGFLVSLVVIVCNVRVLAHTDVTPEEARDLIASTGDLVVVDVRERSEYCDARGHIPGALNYPLNSGVLADRYAELPMDRPILVVCRSGGRSNVAATLLDDQGFPEVYDMTGGMNAWLWETVPCKYAGGSGTSEAPYQIATAADLIALGETPDDHDKYFILTADIDLDPNLPGCKVFEKAVIDSFRGDFDGNGHVISHLTIQGDSNLGLFRRLQDGARISNLGMEAVDVNGTGDYVAGLVGYNLKGSITMSHCTGTVIGDEYVGGLVGESVDGASVATSYSTATVLGNRDVGGLVGTNSGSVAMCRSAGVVDGANRHVGGLVGTNNGSIVATYSTATVSGVSSVGGLVGVTSEEEVSSITMSYSTGTIVGDEHVGGLVGESVDGASVTTSYSTATVLGHRDVGGLVGTNSGSITMCRSAGAVDGTYQHVGGLVGANNGSIVATYSTATVSGVSSVGGLVGVTSEGEASSITMSYSTGAVTGDQDVGGLVGENVGSTASGFWNVETSGQATSAGGTGLTTLLMHDINTYLEAGWDFVDEVENGEDDLWRIDRWQDYPRLWWESPEEDPNDIGDPELVLPVHRLWSAKYVTYFYTIDEAEKNELLWDSQGAWEYQGVAFYAYVGEGESGLVPVHRFYSESLRSYFYTTSEGEKDWLIEVFPDVWTYDRIVFYVFGEMDRSDTWPVHRFWSPSRTCYFYTIDEDERTEFAMEESDAWVYEGVIGYAYSDPVPANGSSESVPDIEVDISSFPAGRDGFIVLDSQ